MRQYLEILRRILDEGEDVATGAFLPGESRRPHARCLVGVQYRHDLRESFPAVTTKKLFWKGVVAELLWFLRGETTLDFLHQHNVHIWDQWAGKRDHDTDDVGPVYGEQWRHWPYATAPADQGHAPLTARTPPGHTLTARTWDQVGEVVRGLRAVAADPSDRARRRLVVSAWNAPVVPEMGLAPCHTLWQALPTNGVLHMVCHWRSIDMLFGFPFNIASYALLTHVLAAATGLKVGTLTANIADCHLYDNQFDAVVEQLDREPRTPPRLFIAPMASRNLGDLSVESCRRLKPGDFMLADYYPHPKLSIEPEIAE